MNENESGIGTEVEGSGHVGPSILHAQEHWFSVINSQLCTGRHVAYILPQKRRQNENNPQGPTYPSHPTAKHMFTKWREGLTMSSSVIRDTHTVYGSIKGACFHPTFSLKMM